jgi:hypothetical protein
MRRLLIGLAIALAVVGVSVAPVPAFAETTWASDWWN